MNKTRNNPPRDDAENALIVLGTASVETKGDPGPGEPMGLDPRNGISDE